jgi:anti-sigma B factor antagonist
MEKFESEIKVEYGFGKTFITFGDAPILEEHEIKKLKDALVSIIDEDENKNKELILNFANVELMSSAFLGLLINIHKRVSERNGHLQLLNVNSNIYKVFEITRLDKVFDIS